MIYLAPLVLWFLSLIFAVMVLLRKRYEININSTSESKEIFEKKVKIKYTGCLKTIYDRTFG